MSNQSSAARSGGIGICGALFVLFVALQLTGHIDWHWYEIAMPLWLPAAVALVLALAILVIVMPIALLMDWRASRKIAARRKARAAKGVA